MSDADILQRLTKTLEERKGASPKGSYVAKLYAGGPEAILGKIDEEASEVLLAAKDGDKLQLVKETADLWFHCLVMLSYYGLTAADVLQELQRREGVSGLVEKAQRRKGRP